MLHPSWPLIGPTNKIINIVSVQLCDVCFFIVMVEDFNTTFKLVYLTHVKVFYFIFLFAKLVKLINDAHFQNLVKSAAFIQISSLAYMLIQRSSSTFKHLTVKNWGEKNTHLHKNILLIEASLKFFSVN